MKTNCPINLSLSVQICALSTPSHVREMNCIFVVEKYISDES